MRKLLSITVISLLSFSCATTSQQPVTQPAYSSKAEIESLKVQISRNEKKTRNLEERVSKVEDKVAENEQNIYDLRKEIEQLKNVISQITAGTPAPQPEVEQKPQPVVQMGAKDLYRQAFNAMEAGDFDKAEQLFQQLVQQYPDSDLADNALYWIGEIYYSHNDYETAAKYFQDVIDKYPNGNKVPAAMLKLALCYRGMGDIDKAKEILQEVIQKYPGTPESGIAKVKLMELEQENGNQ